MSSVDILNTEFGWVNREDGTPISTTPIDFSPPPSGCFWTDLVGVSQDCDTTPPEPPADFIFQNMPGGILKVCVATARNLTDGGVASSVLVQDGFSELLLWDHGDENASNDPLVGSGIMSPGVRHCTMSETTVYAANIDFSVGSGALMMAAIPYATFRGNFTSYTYDVNVGAAIGFDGSTDSLVGIEWYPQESSVIMLISKGATRGLEIWAKYDNGDLATGWQKQGEIPAPASPASLSDNKLYYDGQINSVVLQNNNGRPGSENIWWAYSLGRTSGTGGVRPNGYNTLITVTGGALYWNGRYRFWQTDSGDTYLIGNDGDDNLVKCDFSGNVSPLFSDSAVSGFEPFGSAEGGGELGSRVFVAPRTDCSGTDVFGFLWRMDGDRVPTTVNLAYMGCQIYASATGLKRVFGRLTNQCI